ncbi:hypothetical protein M406DRAFT_72013 [Cryphonectria parasitica EP155]|uniref:Uncharacterized protein n=1 Tax=Cryphonectria parasitica (strain ATCC 38755 / EP155) TaxID=660469 RepID=A0A9P4Y9S2_CRYP1|nr:uncharacterized protein M406DRAFT_72013 [Cryphonectria parasitica EP155]KAF3769060.1 hypothetical protein M406DRAFT_72013 [Cryphonectria parasitica EP155]
MFGTPQAPLARHSFATRGLLSLFLYLCVSLSLHSSASHVVVDHLLAMITPTNASTSTSSTTTTTTTTTEGAGEDTGGMIASRNKPALLSLQIPTAPSRKSWSHGDLDRHRAEVKFGKAKLARLLRPEGVQTVKINTKFGEAKLARLLRPEGVQSIRGENVHGRVVWKIVTPKTTTTTTTTTTPDMVGQIKSTCE